MPRKSPTSTKLSRFHSFLAGSAIVSCPKDDYWSLFVEQKTPKRTISSDFGILLIGFLLGTLIESRKENDRLSSVIRSLPYSMQAPALLQSHGGGVGITSDGGQLVVSCGDLPDPWISNDHKHAVISLR